MAKKEENKNRKTAAKKPKAGETPKKRSSNAASKSGKVKGPMGVGGTRKPSTSAEIREPSKITQSPKGRFEDSETEKKDTLPTATENESITSKISNSTPRKGLPEKTSTTEEHLVVRTDSKHSVSTEKASKEKKSGMKPKDTNPIILEESSLTAKKTKPTTEVKEPSNTAEEKKNRKPATRKPDSRSKKQVGKTETGEEKEQKKPAKKMSRRKEVKGISAEEKVKLPNTSTSEDISEAITSTAQQLIDSVIPDKSTQEDLKRAVKSALPDQDDLKKTAEDLSKNLIPDADSLNKIADKILPDNELVNKAKKMLKDEAEPNEPVEASLISAYDVHLFKEGKHFHLYKKFGSHVVTYLGTEGVYFALWAPNAEKVHVIGDFNDWSKQSHPMIPRRDESGIWEAFIPEARQGSLYKYFIQSTNGYEAEKGDPFAFLWETPPNTASVVWDLEATWNDKDWMSRRKEKDPMSSPMSVYELHIGSWRRVPEDNGRSLSYREMAEQLPEYLKEMGFTHVEFMPVMEHPFFGSWGYQITGYFAPSSRFGNPQDFMHLIDTLHQAGIGVILDWVPSHFPSDLHGLHYFDGTFLYEHQDMKKGFHPDWQSYIFNYGRNEVRCFLISNALFWLDKFHADGLRVDAVASMLYLDYSRKEGEWEPNEFGGRENLEAISFLKEFNEVVYSEFPDSITIAEESTAWPMVSRPTYLGGLGFGQKWMMGWMHDTLNYFQKDPIHRKHHQNTITFSTNYAFTENFMLPLSHDEVVYGKQSLLNKMPGDQWRKFANLRSLYAYMYAHPGTKLIFMGGEFGQTSEWNHDSSLDWHLLHEQQHEQLRESLKALNQLYQSEPALYENSFTHEGFQWVTYNDSENSVISFLRKGKKPEDNILVICNFTPIPRENYRLEIEEAGNWKEIFNSDDERFGGSNVKNQGDILSRESGEHFSIAVTLPPLGVIYLKKTNT